MIDTHLAAISIPSSRQNERGSVIFWIFLGVALFAALNVAFMNISRVGQPGDMTELDRLRATDIIQYANAMQSGIRVMTIDGKNENDFCFHTNQWGHNDYEFTPACDDDTNKVFHPLGGAINFQSTVADWFGDASDSATITDERQWVFSGTIEIENVGTDSGSSSSSAANADLIMALAPIKNNVCMAINNMLSYGTIIPAVTSGTHDELAAHKFTGSYHSSSRRIGDFGRERCVRDAKGYNMYYKVILAR